MVVDFKVIIRRVNARMVRVRVQLLLDLIHDSLEEDLSLDDHGGAVLPTRLMVRDNTGLGPQSVLLFERVVTFLAYVVSLDGLGCFIEITVCLMVTDWSHLNFVFRGHRADAVIPFANLFKLLLQMVQLLELVRVHFLSRWHWVADFFLLIKLLEVLREDEVPHVLKCGPDRCHRVCRVLGNL